mgnify:CR=1 FL=1
MKKNRRNNSRPAAIATAKDTTKAIETRAGVLKEAEDVKKEAKTSFVKETAKLDSLSPLKTLTRGYSIVTKQESGKVIKSVNDLNSGEKVNLRLSDGQKTATID